MWISVGKRRLALALTNSPTSYAFALQPLLTHGIPNLNGQEQHAELPQVLPVSARRAETVRNGDLMPYGAITLPRCGRLASAQHAPNFPKNNSFFNL